MSNKLLSFLMGILMGLVILGFLFLAGIIRINPTLISKELSPPTKTAEDTNRILCVKNNCKEEAGFYSECIEVLPLEDCDVLSKMAEEERELKPND